MISRMKNLCTVIFNELTNVLDIERIVCIDPFSCINDLDVSKKLKIEVHPWIESSELDTILDESLFAALFVPYGTVGTIALNRGVPFVAFYASESSVMNRRYNNLMKGEPFPGFHALGIWEDEAYFPDLAYENPYFKSVLFVDICQPDAFEKLERELHSKNIDEKIHTYQKWVASIKTLTFASCLDHLYSHYVPIKTKDIHL